MTPQALLSLGQIPYDRGADGAARSNHRIPETEKTAGWAVFSISERNTRFELATLSLGS